MGSTSIYRVSILLAVALAIGSPLAAALAGPDNNPAQIAVDAIKAAQARPAESVTVMGKRSVSRAEDFWIEDAYQQYQSRGPEFAKGLIIWSHSSEIMGRGAAQPPPVVLQGLAARGWDVIRLQRNSRLDMSALDDRSSGKATWAQYSKSLVSALGDQVTTARADGYKRVILAGQGLGGGLAIEAAVALPDLYGVLAFSPNIGYATVRGRGMDISDGFNQANLEWTVDRIAQFRAKRAVIVFPRDDEQTPGLLRGARARQILAGRREISYLIADETGPLVGHFGADDGAFLPTATCMDYFVDPEFAPRLGEFKCGTDEVPMALAAMGVRPNGQRSWFGYSTTGVETYLEFAGDGSGPISLALGRGALAQSPGSVRQYDAKISARTVEFALTGQSMAQGVWNGDVLRLTVEGLDGTRSAASMRRIGVGG